MGAAQSQATTENTIMIRNELVGYLLGALDEPESRRVEMALADPQEGPALRRDLEALRAATRPLASDRDPWPAPPGLAGRTIRFVATAANAPQPLPMPRAFTPEPAPWAGASPRVWLDRMVIAATALAACVLVGPLLLESIAGSRTRRAERSLMKLSGALQGYASSHRAYPTPPDSGPLSRAGLYAPTLVSEQRLVADDGTLLCPDTPLAKSGTFRIPTLEALHSAVGTPQFEGMIKDMGGDFGYTLGYRDASGRLQPNRNTSRAHHPLMADAPDETGEKSSNHPDGIHHVLFEDGRIRRLSAEDVRGDDHLFKNHDGNMAAGTDSEDGVIGDSHQQP